VATALVEVVAAAELVPEEPDVMVATATASTVSVEFMVMGAVYFVEDVVGVVPLVV
jgi:hypothetical protein